MWEVRDGSEVNDSHGRNGGLGTDTENVRDI